MINKYVELDKQIVSLFNQLKSSKGVALRVNKTPKFIRRRLRLNDIYISKLPKQSETNKVVQQVTKK